MSLILAPVEAKRSDVVANREGRAVAEERKHPRGGRVHRELALSGFDPVLRRHGFVRLV